MHGTVDELTIGTIGVRLIVVLCLVLMNAFFVAAEFSLVSARRSRIDALAATGHAGARLVQQTLARLTYYISAAQLGITVASLLLGWMSEVALAALVARGFRLLGFESAGAANGVAALVIGMALGTFLHIVIGEQAPKSFALVAPERICLWVVRPLRWFAAATKPFTWLLNAASNGVLGLFGVSAPEEGARVHSPEELRLLVKQTSQHGLLNETDSAIIAGVFDFHEKKARDVMRPRTEVVAIPLDITPEDARALMRREGYSRYPVYQESLDDIVGVLLAKDVWLRDGGTPLVVADLVREALFVPDTRNAERVLEDLRRTRAHMAVVLDEYGGTAGILTMEDLIEEVIGDIADEYDAATREALETDGVLELAGAMSLIDVRSDHGIAIPEGSWTTLGGYVFSQLGHLPKMGDRVTFPGGELEVVAMDGRRVAAVRVIRTPAANAAPLG